MQARECKRRCIEIKIEEEYKNKILSAVCAALSIFPFALNMAIVDSESMQRYSGRFNIIFNELRLALNGNSVLLFLVFWLFFSFYYNYFFAKKSKLNMPAFILANIYSIILILGGSFYRTASWKEVFGTSVAQGIKAGLFYIGTVVISYFVLTLIFNYINLEKQRTRNKWICTYSAKSILIAWLIIILCWIPYIVIKYPGILAWDTATALKDYFDNDTLNNGVPVFTVLYFVSYIRLGNIFNNQNDGLALFVCVQSMIMSGVLAYFVCYLERCGVILGYRVVMLIAICILPLYPYTAMQMGSDVPYTITIVFYTIFLIRYVLQKEGIKWYEWLFQAIVLLVMSLSRHTGIYIVIISMIALLVWKDNKQKKCVFFIHMFAIATYFWINLFVVPSLILTNAASGSALLNLTRQQMANYVILYDDLTEEEIQILDRMIKVDEIVDNYNPELADDIWRITNKSISNEDTREYLKLWIKLFFRHPDAYIQAAMNMWYGYFYPDYVCKTKDYIFYKLYNISDSRNIKLYYSRKYSYERELMESWKGLLYRTPLISTLYGIGIYTWMMIFSVACVIWRHRWRFLLIMVPQILTLLICMMSPVCGYTRYAFPIMFIMPFIFGLWFIYEEK